ncbi:type IX secretion system membrane protein PorP/SprF, partial [Maribacter sp. SA7]|uniref:type IX secretion system membrane protein PorP/SprF n=1 Tax=Maribacter zhoushanensis TaxID=3030012 RepID=UPI0023EB232D
MSSNMLMMATTLPSPVIYISTDKKFINKKTIMNKIFISLCITMSVFAVSYAQQDAQYTQYMYNTISVNPAYAGSRGVFSIAALHRSQWV